MIRTLRYVNSLGEEVSFGGDPEPGGAEWHFGETDIFNVSLEYESVGDSITSFHSGVREFSLTAYMARGTVSERNRLVDVVAYDTRTMSKGRLYAGGSYMECWVTAVEVSRWHYDDSFAAYDLTVVTDDAVWVREQAVQLTQRTSEPTGGLNYPHDHPFNYLMPGTSNTSITNSFMLPAKCDLSFAGPCVSPYVIIGGNRYQVNATAEKGQLIVVRGRGAKDIVLKDPDGAETSIFSKGVREDGAHVFAEVPIGESLVSWPGTPAIEVRMYEERSTPWWT